MEVNVSGSDQKARVAESALHRESRGLMILREGRQQALEYTEFSTQYGI